MKATRNKVKKKPAKTTPPKRYASKSIWAKIRQKLNLTQVEMAEKIGVTQPWLWRVEAELSVPSILFVTRACKELDVSIREVERYYHSREKYFKRSLFR